MTDKEFNEQGKAFELGFLDGLQNAKTRLWVLANSNVSDRDFSDYWFGWHKGKQAVQAGR